MAASRARLLVTTASIAMIAAGCGSSAKTARSPHTAGPDDLTAVRVIRAWSAALRQGDVNGAARYFALPSEFINGPGDAVVIHNEGEAQAVNATLPCGAVLISTERHGRYVSALFRLTNRPGGGCGTGTGQLARTDFIIAKGRIVEWVRADAGGAPPGPVAPPTTPGPVV
jgi:hypothetical protein